MGDKVGPIDGVSRLMESEKEWEEIGSVVVMCLNESGFVCEDAGKSVSVESSSVVFAARHTGLQ